MKNWMILSSLLFMFTANSAVSPRVVNALIKKNKVEWIAAETSVSKLTDAETRKLLGSIDRPDSDTLFDDRTKILDAHDWRNHNGVNWVGAVLDQGQCGSCVAFGAVATLETQYRISAGVPWIAPSFSPQQLFNCGGGACDSGWFAQSAADTLVNKGIVDTACVPYVSGSTGKDIQCKVNFCNNQAQRTYKLAGYERPSFAGGTASQVKAALKRGPLMTNMTVYDDFMVYSSGIYKAVSNTVAGGHVVSIVGFNDLERYWIIRNSWGAGWGEGGFARISYDDKSGIAANTWLFKAAPESNFLSIVSPKEREYVSGAHNVQIKMAKAAAAEVVLSSNNGATVHKMAACEGTATADCSMTIGTLALKDGRYEIHVQSGDKRSTIREFFISNNEPQTTVAFSGVDLAKAQTGRIVFNVDMLNYAVIPQKLTLVLVNDAGVSVVNKSTTDVFEKMSMSLRTPAVSNGSYTMYFVAETPVNGKIVQSISEKKTITIAN